MIPLCYLFVNSFLQLFVVFVGFFFVLCGLSSPDGLVASLARNVICADIALALQKSSAERLDFLVYASYRLQIIGV